MNLLNITVHAYTRMKCVDYVSVVWHDPRRTPPSWLTAFRPTTNSLNNRFDISATAGYTAALHVDDDFLLSEPLVCSTYSRWTHHQSSVFVFDPRLVDFKRARYVWNEVCRVFSYNTGFVTKGAIFHTQYLRDYFQKQWHVARTAITKHVTGEDLLMSAVLAERRIIAVCAHSHVKKLRSNQTSLASRTSRYRPMIMRIIAQTLRTTLMVSNSTLYGAPSLALGNIKQHCYVY
jgi:hypothetical protein